MRVVKRQIMRVTLEDFSKILGVKVEKVELRPDAHVRLTSKNKEGEIVNTYLRCADISGLFGLSINIFDGDLKVKNNVLTYYYEKEVMKKKFNLRKLKSVLNGLLN